MAWFVRSGASRTPLEALDGTITPSGLHFEMNANTLLAVRMPNRDHFIVVYPPKR